MFAEQYPLDGALTNLAKRYFDGRREEDLNGNARIVDDNGIVLHQHYGPKGNGRVTFLYTMACMTVVDTLDGLVLIDGGAIEAEPIQKEIHKTIRSFSSKPIHTIIYTHGHVDHIGAPYNFPLLENGHPKMRVVAHENVPARFDRYKFTSGYNSHINSVQFRRQMPWPTKFVYPDVTYRDELELTIGGIKFSLFHDKGETDDSTWVHLPHIGAICTGDLFIWATPNCGNPQKVQRYPIEWALAMLKMDKLDATFLFPGHGVPIFGKPNIHRALTETALLLTLICKHGMDGINAGKSLNEIVTTLEFPPDLIARQYLKVTYDEPVFILQNLWRRYAGWYDQVPSHLKPPKSADLGSALSKLAGSPTALAKAAEKESNIAVACELVDYAAFAAPKDKTVHTIRAAIYRKRSTGETSLMSQSIYMKAAMDSEEIAGVPQAKLQNQSCPSNCKL